jgi:hypothetical protein
MKRIYFAFCLLLSTVYFANAQSNKAIESQVSSFNEKVKTGNYSEASSILKSLEAEVDSLMKVKVAEAFPKESGTWQLSLNNQAQNGIGAMMMAMPSMASGGGKSSVNIVLYYKDKSEKPDTSAGKLSPADPKAGMILPGAMFKKSITVTVTTNGYELSQFLQSYANENASPPGDPMGNSIKAAKVKNYRAVIKDIGMMKMHEEDVAVGASLIKISGQALDDNAAVEKLAEAIDFNKIKALFGE